MKFNFDKHYLKLCKYIGITCVLVYLSFRFIDSVPFLFHNVGDFFEEIYDITFPIILGFIIAFLMYGLTNGLEKIFVKSKFFKNKKKLARAFSIIISYITVIGFLISLLCGIYFMIGGQISQNSTINNIMLYITDHFQNHSLSTESVTALVEKLHLPFGDLISSQVDKVALFLQDAFASIMDSIADTIFDLGSNLFSLIISITLSIYVLASHEYFLELWDKFFFIIFRNKKCGKSLRRTLHIMSDTFSKYIHGQLIEASIVAILSTLVMSFIGVDYAFVIGIICGIFNLIPYIGPFIGIVIAAIITLFSGHLWMVIATIICLLIVQQIDCNFLCPKIVGDIVGLHPALVLIAVTIGGNWYGLLGMIIAVPVTASIKTIINDWYTNRIEDSYEKSKDSEPEQTVPDNPTDTDAGDDTVV